SLVDNLVPMIKDPNGHDNVVHSHGGWIAHVDSTGQHWELIASGFRNAFDMAFNPEGELFTYDSDMEWDFGTPWYRPTRICHVTSGAEFGWRPGTAKWSPDYPDNLPAIVNIGQGSPTNVMSPAGARFPEKYRKSIFAFDWSFGIVYAIHLQPKGSSYSAKAEEFLSGAPLPLTDGVIGPDGAMYFLTGGRRLESDLYRVYYKDNSDYTDPLPAAKPSAELTARRNIEQFHGGPKPGAIDAAWPALKSDDRFLRYAARVAVENQPLEQWKDKALAENDPIALTGLAIALAHKGDSTLEPALLDKLTAIDYAKLEPSAQLDLLRAFELVIARMGKPAAPQLDKVNGYLSVHYPAASNPLNRMLSKLLVYLDAPQAVEKTMALMARAKDDSTDQQTATASSDLIMRNPQYGLDIARMLANVPPMQQTWYATVLSQAANGWTPALQDQYFGWYANAFAFKGGHSFFGFINGARKSSLALVPKDQFDKYNKLSGDSLAQAGNVATRGVQQPKGPGRRWKLEEAVAVIDSGLAGRDFERGKAMFTATLCSACHSIKGEGGVAGPDLTQLGTRFSSKDILEAIIDPSRTVSDQYAATVFTMKDGTSIVGRLVSQDDHKYVV
ncbi:c-type cytochrome, partial [Chitinophaga lutea]